MWKRPTSLRRLVPLLAIVAAIAVVPACMTRSSGAPDGAKPAVDLVRATVVRVVDGDTVRARLADGRTERVRFIGVDTPESTIRHEPFGTEASAYTKRELRDRTVWLQLDVEHRDRYDRLLAYVWLEPPTRIDEKQVRERMFNARLLVEGYAQLLTVPPNVAYVERFRPLETEARNAGRGLWALP